MYLDDVCWNAQKCLLYLCKTLLMGSHFSRNLNWFIAVDESLAMIFSRNYQNYTCRNASGYGNYSNIPFPYLLVTVKKWQCCLQLSFLIFQFYFGVLLTCTVLFVASCDVFCCFPFVFHHSKVQFRSHRLLFKERGETRCNGVCTFLYTS